MEEDVTQLLRSLGAGDKAAESRLISLVYHELYAIAARLMRHERPDHTLQPTALVNEAYLKLVNQRDTDWKDRSHFFGTAAQVMRHILIDWARQNLAGKRGGGRAFKTLDEVMVIAPSRLEDLLILEDALQRLEIEDPRAGQVFVLRFYGGLGVDEVAEIIQFSPRTVKRDWDYGRAWLKAELKPRT
jgi:RNA polymerase sigma-70 factor (ECF subfamily)